MKILILGSGGREHAIGLKLSQSPRKPVLIFAPGNPGTASHGTNLSLDVSDHAAVIAFVVLPRIFSRPMS